MRRGATQVLIGYTIVVGWLAVCTLLWSCPAAAESRPPETRVLE